MHPHRQPTVNPIANAMNSTDRKALPGTSLDYFDAAAAVTRLQAGA